MKPRISFVILTTVAVASAILFSDQILYKHILVPRLEHMYDVSVIWWFFIYSPILAVCFIAGSKVKSITELVCIGILGGICNQIYGFLASEYHQPGHLKSWAWKAPLEFWTSYLLLSAILYSCVFAMGWLIAKAVARPRAS